MTTAQRPYPTRMNVSFQNRRGQVALDQIRVVDRSRLIKKLGVISDKVGTSVSALLVEIFQR